jgi:hypothetical protein
MMRPDQRGRSLAGAQFRQSGSLDGMTDDSSYASESTLVEG